jgi:hypothetical protein
MKYDEQRKILLILPSQLVELADEAAETLQISRAGFLRQSIARNVARFHRDERQSFCVPKDYSG